MSSRKKVLIVGVFLIFLNILSLIYYVIPKIKIELNGDKNITINVGEDYQEEGAIAYLEKLNKNENLKVETEGKVNTDKVGKYIITYRAKTKAEQKEIIRVINVVDKVKPEISLNGRVIGCKNNNILEFDISAYDNYDNDITDKIEYKIIDDEIYFYVTDSSNNKAELKEKVNYVDAEKPSITLNGSEDVYINIGSTYTELGATAYDSCDGNISDGIKITNNIDNQVPGIYDIIYEITDSYGNTTQVVRKIHVSEKNETFKEVENKGTIYLTFDDGPGKYTQELLSILNKYQIKATFFVTNQFPTYQYLIKDIYEEGHTIGIHTYTHKWSIYESIETYYADFLNMENIIYEQTGIRTNIFRFPGGSSNTVSKNYSKGIMTKLAKYMQEKGYIYYDWTFDSGDTNKKDNSEEAIFKNFQKYLKGDGDYVVLMHDIKPNTIKVLPKIIEIAKSAGYTFSEINEKTPECHFKIVN